jgi:hypothetical protein
MARPVRTRRAFARVVSLESAESVPTPARRLARTQPVTAQMYRHFAVVTGAITLLVGLFADGEHRQAVAGEMQRSQPSTKTAVSSELAVKTKRTSGGFAGENGFDGPFGAPMDSVGAAAHDGISTEEDFAPDTAAGIPAGLNRYGVSAKAWAALTEAQRNALIARHNAAQQAAQAPARAAEIEHLMAASRARSGEASDAE